MRKASDPQIWGVPIGRLCQINQATIMSKPHRSPGGSIPENAGAPTASSASSVPGVESIYNEISLGKPTALRMRTWTELVTKERLKKL